MGLVIHTDPVPLDTDATGTARVGGTRVPLDRVVWAYRDGATPEQVAAGYDVPAVADVYAVVGYYLRHRGEVDAYLAERGRQAEALVALFAGPRRK